jgi:tripartite-type tricarboxylate transporter receptor subunit TctC
MNSRNRRSSAAALPSLATLIVATAVVAAAPVMAADYYAGKSIKLTVGSDVGGGYDTYSRLLARHMGRHIPGAPSIVVMNMPGAGGLRSVQYLYTVAPKDGTEFANIRSSNMLDSILGLRGEEIDPNKYVWIGSMASDTDVCAFWSTSGIRSFDDMLNKPTKIGSTARGAQAFSFPNSINYVLGTKMDIINGYKGTNDRALAMERGELSGMCGLNGSTLISVLQQPLGEGKLIPVVQSGLRPHPLLKNVPLTQSFAKTPEQKQILEAIFAQMDIARAFAAPPDTAAEPTRILRKAFLDTLADAGFKQEADKLKLELDPMSGEDVQTVIAQMSTLSDDLKKKVRDAIGE